MSAKVTEEAKNLNSFRLSAWRFLTKKAETAIPKSVSNIAAESASLAFCSASVSQRGGPMRVFQNQMLPLSSAKSSKTDPHDIMCEQRSTRLFNNSLKLRQQQNDFSLTLLS